MRIRSRLLLMMLILLTAACQGPPPTQYVIVTPTPTVTPVIIVVTATPDPASLVTPTFEQTIPSPTTAVATVEVIPTDIPATPEVTTEPQTIDNGRPTVTVAQIQVAEQRFQGGRMYWLQPIDQIWVMVESQQGQGIWTVYDDAFEEGEIEFDPAIVAPEGLLQPERGFGKLWRENEEIREALGWGLQPEVGFVSNYRYEPGGDFTNGQFVPGYGSHVLNSSEGDVFRFNEINGTWQLLRSPRQGG